MKRLSKAEVSPENKLILEAIVSGPIIKDLSDEMIRGCFIVGMGLSGVKDFPEEAMTLFIIKQIRLQHPTFTVNEINLAFEMNAAGLLGERVKAYNSFDLEYVTSVLESYMMKRLEARRELEKNTPKLPEHISTDKELFEGLKEMVERNGEFPQFYNWNAVFKHMEEVGLIKLSIEEKQAQFKDVFARMSEQRTMDAFKGFDITETDFKSRVITECRRLMVKKFL